MRKLVADIIISLDGYFTSPKNEIDWFDFEYDEWVWSSELLRRADAMLYGRVTYEEFRQFWPTEGPKRMGVDPYQSSKAPADASSKTPKPDTPSS